MPPSEAPGRPVPEDAAAAWSAAGLCRFAIYAQRTVLTLIGPKPKRQRAGALQKLRHVVAPPRGRCANAPCAHSAQKFGLDLPGNPAMLRLMKALLAGTVVASVLGLLCPNLQAQYKAPSQYFRKDSPGVPGRPAQPG